MNRMSERQDERGIALLTVLLVGFALSAIALAGTMWILNAQMVQKNGERSAVLNDVAVAAVEEGRSRIAANPLLYPLTGHDTLELWAPVQDALAATVPGVKRSIFVGPEGVTSGQYGVYGTIISMVKDTFGNLAVRRLQINQESFAKYAYFTTVEGDIVFANDDQIRGPVHSNDQIEIHSSGATFHSTVTTAASSIRGEGYGTFRGGPPKKNVPVIPLPTTKEFNALKTRAQRASMYFPGNSLGSTPGQASIRLDFVAIDLNNDDDSTDTNEGFVRIYQNNQRPWQVTAHLHSDIDNDIRQSPNCGAPVWDRPSSTSDSVVVGVPALNSDKVRFWAASERTESFAEVLLSRNNAKWVCYLGGDPRLKQGKWGVAGNLAAVYDTAAWSQVVGTLPRPTTTFTSGGSAGWVQRPPAIEAPTDTAFTNRPDAAYLFPINRTFNKNWEGVIYVEGKVAISGVVSGRVTLATERNIIIADDIRTAVDPGSATAADCSNILGLFSGDSIIVADNTINTPQRVPDVSGQRTYDLTPEEDIHAVLLALEIFGAERYSTGPSDGEDCSTSDAGRGCLALKGGIIQKTRGAVGLTSGEGYIKRYEYNACAASDPPPYFPTTGKFARNRIYELDPRNFDVANWFATRQNN
jgi:hypothetical protein